MSTYLVGKVGCSPLNKHCGHDIHNREAAGESKSPSNYLSTACHGTCISVLHTLVHCYLTHIRYTEYQSHDRRPPTKEILRVKASAPECSYTVPQLEVVVRVRIPVSLLVGPLYQTVNPLHSISCADPLRTPCVPDYGMPSDDVECFLEQSDHRRRARFVVVFVASRTRVSFIFSWRVMSTGTLPIVYPVLVIIMLSRSLRVATTSCPGRIGVIDLDHKQPACITFSCGHPLQYGGKRCNA